MSKEYFLILDVETANDTNFPLVYDLGFQVIDRQGNVYKRESLIIYEIYVLERGLMKSAYYAEKIPEYEERLKNKESHLVTLDTARRIITQTIREYNIKRVGAYNASFDRRALNTTIRFVTKSEKRYFMPYGVEWFCIWYLACQVLLQKKKFFKMAEEEGWFSPSGNLQTNAEVCYRFLIGGHEFQEEHKGLDDVVIESFIFTACIRQHKKLDWGIKFNCWQMPNNVYKGKPAISPKKKGGG